MLHAGDIVVSKHKWYPPLGSCHLSEELDLKHIWKMKSALRKQNTMMAPNKGIQSGLGRKGSEKEETYELRSKGVNLRKNMDIASGLDEEF